MLLLNMFIYRYILIFFLIIFFSTNYSFSEDKNFNEWLLELEKEASERGISKETFNKAMENYKKALTLDDNNPHLYFNIANCYSALKYNNEAIINYEKALKIDGKYYNAHNNLGTVYLNTNDFLMAEFHFKEALKIIKNFPEAILNLYFSYIFQDKISEAILLLTEAIDSQIINEKITKVFFLLPKIALFRETMNGIKMIKNNIACLDSQVCKLSMPGYLLTKI